MAEEEAPRRGGLYRNVISLVGALVSGGSILLLIFALAPRHRKRFVYVVLGGTFLSVFMAFVTYNAFLYSESVPFCGTLCHTVMQPEYMAYLASPHARVA